LSSLQQQRAWPALLGGVALGIAALYKPNVPVLLVPAWTVARLAVRRQRLPARPAMVAGGAAACSTVAVIAPAPIYYAALGHFDVWRFYNIDALLLYRGMGGSVWQQALWLAEAIPLKIPCALGLLYGAIVAARAGRSSWEGEVGLFLVTAWLLLFCSLAPGLHKAHYLIQSLPAQCL